MKYYTEVVPFEVAVKLKNAGYWNPGCTYETSYNGSCYVTYSKNLYPEGVVADWKDIVPAPTYAEVIDWFMDKGIFIGMEPWYTFALECRMGFTYTINTVDHENAKINREYWKDFASFGLCMDSAIIRALELIEKATE